MNPGRTSHRVINVDLNKQVMKVDGELPVLLTELEYVIADLYITLHIQKGIHNDDIDNLFNEVKENGMKTAWNTIKKARNIEG